ncbi:MAG: alpha-ribazole phosphatase [Bacteroidota bacterium]
MEVYVIRHTPVAVDKSICYGQTNVPLASTFLEDAAATRRQLPDKFDAVYSSPLERCKNLATTLKVGKIHSDERLLEVNFGDWEGVAWHAIDQETLNNWMFDFVNVAPPKGENLNSLNHRVGLFLEELRQRDLERVLLVTHAGVIRCIWANLLEIPLKNIFKIPVAYGEVFAFRLGKNTTLDSIFRLK